VEDQPADSGDLTTDAELPAQPAGVTETDAAAVDAPAVAEPEPAQRRPRWGLLRRGSKTAEAAPISVADEPEEAEEPKPARRTPVGKAGRTAKAAEVDEPTIEAEPTEEAAENEQAEPTEAPEPAEEAAQAAVAMVPHRPAGKRLKIAAVAASVLFVGAAAFAGAMLQPYVSDRAQVETKLDVARTATDAITTLWTYTPDNMDSLPDRAAGYLGGDFAHEYRKYIDAIVAPNKQAQVTNTTEVVGAAVESLTPSEATAIVYTNSVATSPVTKNIPSLRYLSYRLTMERRDAKWLITRMSTVTSLDLTPRM
jgi:Mce-associated membrane protein